MSPPAEPVTGSVYDLGYRNYEGVRLGRRHAIAAVYTHSLRGIFGLGRHTSSKVIPIGLTVIALIPAVVHLGIVALSKDVVDIFRASDYYEFIQWPLALFVAAVAPELVGRDQRDRTLSLYFSRALLRSDYILAKVAALTTAVFILALLPQALLFLGNSLASTDSFGYLRDNWRDIAPIVASGALLALFMSSIALAIGSQTSRWPLASGGILAYFAISWVLGSILVNSFGSGPMGYSLLLSGFHVIRGFTMWLFGITPPLAVAGQSGSLSEDLALAGVPLYVYAVAAGVIIAATLFILHRRYRRLAV